MIEIPFITDLFARWQYWRNRASRRQKAFHKARVVQQELSRLGFVHEVRATRKTKRRIQRVEFESPAILTPEELWLPLDLSKLPRGRSTNDLREPDVLQSLSDRLHSGVRIDTLPTGRLCLVVRMSEQRFPTLVSINKFIDPPDNAGTLAFPLGVDVNGQELWGDLVEMKHLLIAGATGGGKTNMVHAMLYTWINRNTPDKMELWLIDLKGQEAGKYRRLLSKEPGDTVVRFIADEPESALKVLSQAVDEIKRRNKLMTEWDASNLDDLYRVANIQLARVVVVCDEIAVLTLNKDTIGKSTVGAYAQNFITNIAALGRASGVHIVIATQHVKTEVLTGLIQANFENRVVFSTADWRKSQLMIEDSGAVSLPVGRCIVRHSGEVMFKTPPPDSRWQKDVQKGLMELQTPYITPDQIRMEVGRIAQHGPKYKLGDGELIRHVRNAKVIIELACEQFGGNVPTKQMRSHPFLREHMTRGEFEQICVKLERDGILSPAYRTTPRRVVPAFQNRPEMLDAFYRIDEDRAAEAAAHEADSEPQEPVIIELEAQEWRSSPASPAPAHPADLAPANVLEFPTVGNPLDAIRAAGAGGQAAGVVLLGVGKGNRLTGRASTTLDLEAMVQAALTLVGQDGRFVVVQFAPGSSLAAEVAAHGARVGVTQLDYVTVAGGQWHSFRINKSGDVGRLGAGWAQVGRRLGAELSA